MKRSRIKPVSAKKARRNAVYARSRMEVAERCGGRCEARFEVILGVECSGWLEHVHHRRLRSQGGSDDPSNLVGLCNNHHRWAHANPKAAAELGLIDLTSPEPLSTAVRRVEKVNRGI